MTRTRYSPASTIRWPSVVLRLGHRLRRWPSIKTAKVSCFAGLHVCPGDMLYYYVCVCVMELMNRDGCYAKVRHREDVRALVSGLFPSKHLHNICTMLDQRRRRWADVVQCYTNVLSLLGFVTFTEPKTLYIYTLTVLVLEYSCVNL